MRIQNKFGWGFRQKKDLSYFGSEPNSFLEKLDSGSNTLYCIIVDVCKSLGYPKVVVWSMVYVPSVITTFQIQHLETLVRVQDGVLRTS